MPRPKQHLKFKGITPKTARAYKKEISRFFVHLAAEGKDIPNSITELDYELAEFINSLYHEGDSLTQAGWLLSGFKRFVPRLKFRLPTAQQYYNNWLRDHVPHRAVPMPWLLTKALAAVAWRTGHYDISVLLLVGYCFFLRTMEFLTLPLANITVDPSSSQIVISLDRAKTSKQFQQSLVLRHRTLSMILSRALPRLRPRSRLWLGSARDFRNCFTALLCHFGLEDYKFSLYSIRRGGATHAYAQTRDLHYITLQGRWKDVKTSRIYLDDARATLIKLSFPPPITHHLHQSASFWENFG